MNIYIFSYDPISTGNISNQILSFIRDHKNISSWIKPAEGFYILKSTVGPLVLYNSFNAFFEGQVSFVVSAAKPSQMAGTLPQEMWNWLNENPFAGIFGNP